MKTKFPFIPGEDKEVGEGIGHKQDLSKKTSGYL